MRSFASLFQGRDDVCGRYTVPAGTKPTAKGKLAGTASTKRERVSEASYQSHLKGTKRLGIVPIRPGSNDCYFMALDVDVYKTPTLQAELAAKIRHHALPLVMTRTKSGGAHLWMFFRDPMPAARARELAAAIVKKLRLDPKTEIFPKQDRIQESDDGSWINLPYFGESCIGLGPDGVTELTLPEFLQFANDRLQAGEDLKVGISIDEDVLEGEADMPPCIAKMLKEGIEEGGRDNAVTHIGVYVGRAYPEDWEDRLAEINDEYVKPPLSAYDIGKVIKSLGKKNYQYFCKQQPMCSLCDREACLTKKFGVGGGEAVSGSPVLIDAIRKIAGEDPIYTVTMYGRDFNVNGETLFRYSAFQIAAMKSLDRILPAMTQTKWMALLNEYMATISVNTPPADTQARDRVVKMFKDWCLSYGLQDGPNVILERGVPFVNGSSVYFSGNDFMNLIDRQLKLPRTQVWAYLSEWGVIQDEIELKDRTVKVWRYPVPPDSWFEEYEKRKQRMASL